MSSQCCATEYVYYWAKIQIQPPAKIWVICCGLPIVGVPTENTHCPPYGLTHCRFAPQGPCCGFLCEIYSRFAHRKPIHGLQRAKLLCLHNHFGPVWDICEFNQHIQPHSPPTSTHCGFAITLFMIRKSKAGKICQINFSHAL